LKSQGNTLAFFADIRNRTKLNQTAGSLS